MPQTSNNNNNSSQRKRSRSNSTKVSPRQGPMKSPAWTCPTPVTPPDWLHGGATLSQQLDNNNTNHHHHHPVSNMLIQSHSPVVAYQQIYFLQEILKRTSLAELKDKELLEWLTEAQSWVPYVMDTLLNDKQHVVVTSTSGPNSEQPSPISNSQTNSNIMTFNDDSLYLYADATPENEDEDDSSEENDMRDRFSVAEFRLLLLRALQTLPWWRIIESIDGAANNEQTRKMNQTISTRHEKIVIAFEKLCFILVYYQTDIREVLILLTDAFKVVPLARDGAQRRLPLESILRVLNFAVAHQQQQEGPLATKPTPDTTSGMAVGFQQKSTELFLHYFAQELLPKPYWGNSRHQIAAVYLLLFLAVEGELPEYVTPSDKENEKERESRYLLPRAWRILEENAEKMKQLKARQEEQKTQQEKKPSKAPAALDVAALKKEEAEGEEDSPYFSPTAEGAQKADGVVFPSNVQQMLAPGETESEAVIQKKIKLEEQQEETLERALDLGVGKTNTDPSHKEADPNPEDTPLHQLDVHYWIHTRQNNRLLYLRDTIIGIVLHRLFTLEDTLEPSSVALRQYDYIISLCFNNHPKGTSAGLHSMSPFSSPASSRPPSANSSSMPSPLPRFPGFGKSELNTLLFEEEKSPTTEEWNTLYDAHLAKMGSLSSLEEYFDKENASQLKALQSSVILLYYTLQEDMQKQILAGVCGNLQWWPLVMEFFFVNLIVHTSPIVSPSSFHNQNSNSAFLLGPSTASEASDTTTNNNNKGNPRGQFYKSTSHVLLYLAPSLSLHGQTKEGVDLLHQLVKIVTSGFYEETFSAQNTHGVSYLDDPQARVPRASNAAAMAPSTLASKGRRTSMLPPTRHSKKLLETQRLHAALHIFPLFRFLYASLYKDDCNGVFRRLLKWTIQSRAKMVDLLMQSASLGREGSSHSGSAFSASRALVGEHTPTEEERVKQLYASFPKLELVLLAQCAAMADMMGEELSPRYDTYKKERQQVLQRMAEQKAKEEEEACQRLSTEGGSEENEESSDDDDDVVVAARQKKKADTTQQKKKQSEMEVFLKNYRNESILEPFIERFRLRSDGKKENTTSDNAIKKEEEEEETSVLRMNLRRLELEGHLRVDLFNFCPWPLPHQLYNHK